MNPDIDEIVAAWLIMNFGNTRFPGADCAELKLVDPTKVTSSYHALLAEGTLCIGFGGGPFDEHPEAGDDGERIPNESAASLVARALGIRNDAAVKRIVDYTVKKDHSADTHEFEIAPLLKDAFRFLLPEIGDPEQAQTKMYDILQAAMVLLDGFSRKDSAYDRCREEYLLDRRETFVNKPNAKVLRIVSVVSNNPVMQKFCRSSEGGFCGVVIQTIKKGNVIIFFDHRQVDKDMVACIMHDIRIAQLNANNYRFLVSRDQLTQDGSIEGAQEWYFEYDKYLIANGTLTHSKLPTSLSREQIELIVVDAIVAYFDRTTHFQQ